MGMKKYFILMMLTLFISTQSFSQPHHRRSSGLRSTEMPAGLIIGGVSLSLMGVLTTPDWRYVGVSSSTIPGNGTYTTQTKPFFQQGPQMMCISTGVILTITGLISWAVSK